MEEKEYTANITLGLAITGMTEEQAHELTRDFIDWIYHWTDYQYYYDNCDDEGNPSLRYITTELNSIVEDAD